MPKNRSRARKGRGRGSGVSLTPSQKFESELSKRKERCILKGSNVFSSSTVTVNTVSLFPANMGQRPSDLSGVFARFRILRLVVKILPPTTTSVALGAFALGIEDDVGLNVAETPVSVSGICALRCSCLFGGGQTLPTELMWNPVDPNRWFYTQNASSEDATESRFRIPATIYFNVTTGSTVTFQVFYTIEFEGAISDV